MMSYMKKKNQIKRYYFSVKNRFWASKTPFCFTISPWFNHSAVLCYRLWGLNCKAACGMFSFSFFFLFFFHFSVTGPCELLLRTVGSSRMALWCISDTTRTLRSLPQCQFVSFLFHLLLFVGETIHCWCLNSARFLFSSTTKTSIALSRPKVLLSRNLRFVRCPVPPDWNIKIKYQLYLSHAHAGQAVTCKCQ